MSYVILSLGNTIKGAVKDSMDQQFHWRMKITKFNLTVRSWLFKGNIAKD